MKRSPSIDLSPLFAELNPEQRLAVTHIAGHVKCLAELANQSRFGQARYRLKSLGVELLRFSYLRPCFVAIGKWQVHAQ